MRRSSWKGFLCGAISLAAGVSGWAQTSLPQKDDFPILNATGRYLGYGWSRWGYQTQGNGQLRLVRSNHPAQRYSSSLLSYPYQPGYQPQTRHPSQQPATALSPSIQLSPARDPVTSPQTFPEHLEAPTLQLPNREEVPAGELLMSEELRLQESAQQLRTFLKPPAPLPKEDPDMLLDSGEGSLEDSSPSDLGSPAPLPPTREQELPVVAPRILPDDSQVPREPPAAEPAPIEQSLEQRIEEQLGPNVPTEEMLFEEEDGGLQLLPGEADELLRMNDASVRHTSVPSLLPAQHRARKETQSLQWVTRNVSHARHSDRTSSSSASYRFGRIFERSQVMRREVQRRSIYLRP